MLYWHKTEIGYDKRSFSQTVLDNLAAKGLLHLHLSIGGCCQISNAPATKAIGHKARREVTQIASAGQADQQPIILPVHLHLAHSAAIVFLNHLRGGIPKRIPELHDVRIGRAPCVHQWLHFLLGHFRSHGFQCADSAAVAAVMDEMPRYGKTVMWSGIS